MNITVHNLQLRLSSDFQLNIGELEIEAGQRLSIIGPNGAGKSTLLKCMSRILPLDGGEIYFDKQATQHFSYRSFARHISYVPQILDQLFPYTVWDWMRMSRYAHGADLRGLSAEEGRQGSDLLTAFGVANFRDRAITDLSGGERQKVFLAAALFQNPKVLLLDEPCAFLDPHYALEIMAVLQDYQQRRQFTLVSVTHDINHALHYSDRILALKQGKSIFLGGPDILLEKDMLPKLYDVTFTALQHPDNQKVYMVPSL